jgi:hypothetical protein
VEQAMFIYESWIGKVPWVTNAYCRSSYPKNHVDRIGITRKHLKYRKSRIYVCHFNLDSFLGGYERIVFNPYPYLSPAWATGRTLEVVLTNHILRVIFNY